MAKAKFSNQKLVEVWATVLVMGGTRRDVVEALMEDAGLDPSDKAEYDKMYNVVTQRVKSLSERDDPVSFPALREGRKGSKSSKESTENLQSVLDAAVEKTVPPDEVPGFEKTPADTVEEAVAAAAD
jgi:hypothetical protein